jgi:hypothetical protein
MRAVVDPAHAELAGLLQEIVSGSDPATEHSRSAPASLLAPLAPGLLAANDVSTADPAERALLGVHRVELARLLREAARLALGLSPVSPDGLREGLREALHAARADRLQLAPEVGELARACLRNDAPRGSALAVELALASLRVDEGLEGRRLLAVALSAGGDDVGASLVLAGTLLTLGRVGSAIAARRRALIAALAASQSAAGEGVRAQRLSRLAERLGEL